MRRRRVGKGENREAWKVARDSLENGRTKIDIILIVGRNVDIFNSGERCRLGNNRLESHQNIDSDLI